MAKGKYQEWLTEDGLLLLRRWARNGLTDDEIAEAMGIGRATLYKWKNTYRDIRDALKKTKEVYDSEVEEALHKSTVGYTVTEREWRRDMDTGEMVLYREYEKYIKPDTTAQIFWLKNRDKLRWRDRQEVEADVSKTSALAILPKREIVEETKENENEN